MLDYLQLWTQMESGSIYEEPKGSMLLLLKEESLLMETTIYNLSIQPVEKTSPRNTSEQTIGSMWEQEWEEQMRKKMQKDIKEMNWRILSIQCQPPQPSHPTLPPPGTLPMKSSELTLHHAFLHHTQKLESLSQIGMRALTSESLQKNVLFITDLRNFAEPTHAHISDTSTINSDQDNITTDYPNSSNQDRDSHSSGELYEYYTHANSSPWTEPIQ
ncbi:uncharacterized protein EV420DRAFT_1654964 [Desarmillaria tabescens]|uniref:Uncharacterized protein n=1 Tax=Armillaria tabescens TaxID=1929756 RepID=A0AA39MGZ3_ARMTA|nr:uncharacterized protein EV420DRAFT_1654964 [Desarmillaria tabescens]KAK0433130.1 hypothetical protein EV420DRAFT_1654964 [Desarmillaria tabescens]